MKKKLKILSWVISVLVVTTFSILLGVLSNSERGDKYTYTLSFVSHDELGNDIIIYDKMTLEFVNKNIIRLTHDIEGIDTESSMGVCFIRDGKLYSTIDSEEFECLGKITAYEFDVFDNEGYPMVFECEKNIKLKTVYTVGIVVGVLMILANAGYETFEFLKKKGIIKIKEKPVKENNEVAPETAEVEEKNEAETETKE